MTIRSSAVVPLAAALAALAAPLVAQDTTAAPPLPPFSYSFDLGTRSMLSDVSSQQMGKFLEYRARPTGSVLGFAHLRYAPGDGFRRIEATARNVGLVDQSVGLRLTQPGLFDFGFKWDRIPHMFSTTGRMAGTRTASDYFQLPDPRPTVVQMNAAPYLDPIRTEWAPVKLGLTVTPTPAWDMKAEYTRIHKTGDRPFGMAFGSPGGNTREILEPIDQTMHDLKLTQSYARERYQLLVGWDMSLFRNGFTSVTADNPLRTTDSPTLGGARGRTSLAPNNVAHTLTGTGAVAFPYKTRVTSTYSYSWWWQQQPLIPATINPQITSALDPRIGAIPGTLDGHAGTKTLNITAASRPFEQLSLNAHFRRYEFRDSATYIDVPVLIINDRSISTPDEEARRNPFRRENRDVSARWQTTWPVSIGVEYNWELVQLDPTHRNAFKYIETTPRLSVDFTGLDWVQIRTRYGKSWRRSEPFTDMDGEVVTYAPSEGYLPGFRRFDVSDRNRERFTLMTVFTPIDELSLSGTWQRGRDDYPTSTYGVHYDKNHMLGADVDYAPFKRLAISGGYSYEQFRNQMSSRYRTPTNQLNTTYDWIAQNTDNIRTASASIDATVIPSKLTVGMSYELSNATFLMAAYNPVTPAGGSAGDLASAKAAIWPMIRQKAQPVATQARYVLTPAWSATLRFQVERYDQLDFRTSGLLPGNTANANVMFLGNDFPSYNARYLTVFMTYQPNQVRLGRSTL